MTRADVDEAALREQLLAALQRLDSRGLNRGSTGNLSHRHGNGMLITPTGIGADEASVDDLVWLGFDGELRGRWKPSSEWHFHQALYQARPELQAVVHTHASHATALACLRRDIPPFHYMVAVAGSDRVRCAPYHLFGTPELSAAVVEAMQGAKACLLANHGLLSAGGTLDEAMKITLEVESLSGSYLAALAIGDPVLLGADEMAAVLARFERYGRSAAHDESPGS